MKHRSLLAIAAVGTLILAACGDDDDDAADTVAVEETSAGAEVDAPAVTDAAAPTTDAGAAVTSATGAETSEPGAAAAETSTPGAAAAETSAPGVEATETIEPGAAAVGTSEPGAAVTETIEPGAAAVETSEPGAAVTETSAPGAAAVETSAPGVEAAETSAPGAAAVETSGPAVETSAPDTTAVETTAVETAAVETSAPDTSAPETSAPETSAPETSAPETSAPETSAPDTSAPDTSAPETSEALAVETSAPDTTAVETTAVETAAVETSAPDTSEALAVETSAPETSAPDTSAPDTSEALAVETSAPDTSAPDTSAPDTSAPDTSAPDTSAPDTSAPDTSAPETSAPGSNVLAAVVGTGPECAELPDFGDGALAELADDPAGTAIANNLETSTLAQLLGRAELLETLDGEGPFTVLAPNNGAFVALAPDQRAALTGDPEVLADVLTYHVIEGSLSSEDLAADGAATALQGEELTFTLEGDVLTINDGQATAVCGDIPIANGTLYLIDGPLVPSSAADALAPATTEAAATDSSGPASSEPTSSEPEGSTPDGTAVTGTSVADGDASGVAFPLTPGEDWPESLTFTLTPSQEAGGLIESAEPLAAALAERLGVEVEALVPSDYAGVIVALDSGQAQIAGGLGPVQMVQAEDEAGAELILQSERFGSFEYVTQWFTNDPSTYCDDEPVANEDGLLFCNGVLDAASASDGPIGEEHLADVAGQTVAFVDQGSASGYLVPSLQLLNAGVDPTADITPLFAGGHDSAVQAVYDGDATVGVSFNDARGELIEQIPDVGEQVVVFAWSFPIPNDGFAVGGDLPPDLQEAITASFLDIAETDPEILATVYEIDGLAAVDSADFDIIRELRTELADLLE